MPKGAGDYQLEPIERLVRMAAVLWASGADGVGVDRLAAVCGFTGDVESGRQQVSRELKHLRRAGWRIDNLARDGALARYRMVPIDNRLAVHLTPAESAALHRAARAADRVALAERLNLTTDGQAPEARVSFGRPVHPDLDLIVDAIRHRRRLTFRYEGRDCVADPKEVRRHGTAWFLAAQQVGQDAPLQYALSRLTDLEAEDPGTSSAVAGPAPPVLDPLEDPVDPETIVTLVFDTERLIDVVSLLGDPHDVTRDAEQLTASFRVVNWSAARARVYELGSAVRVAGSPQFRAAMLADLSEAAQGRSR